MTLWKPRCAGRGGSRVHGRRGRLTRARAKPPLMATLAQELAVPDKARTIVWCGDRLCVGFAKEYNMISINSGIMTDIFPCKGQRPIATRLPNNEILLCRDSTL